MIKKSKQKCPTCGDLMYSGGSFMSAFCVRCDSLPFLIPVRVILCGGPLPKSKTKVPND